MVLVIDTISHDSGSVDPCAVTQCDLPVVYVTDLTIRRTADLRAGTAKTETKDTSRARGLRQTRHRPVEAGSPSTTNLLISLQIPPPTAATPISLLPPPE